MAKTIVTAALPYANGPIHLGHLLEAVQTDIYVRARKLANENIVFVWGADCHGTAIELRAKQEGIDPFELISKSMDDHEDIFRKFNIQFDIYWTTHSKETKFHAEHIYQELLKSNHIVRKITEQFYCNHDNLFLPDRFIKGECPNCRTQDQYGDNCENCGATYLPFELINPVCTICKNTPEKRNSEHLFVKLDNFKDFLKEQVYKTLHPAQIAYLSNLTNNFENLKDWCISRDSPYYGFRIPGESEKWFYVWFDAPCGYIGATDVLALTERWLSLKEAWTNQTEPFEIIHIIGKDIIYFHALFWQVMLKAANYTLPSKIQVHGYLNVNGEKMSKSRGTFILGKTYLEHLNPEYLRYYFASKLSELQEDFNFDIKDFVVKVNSDLINNLTNLISRTVVFINNNFDNTLGKIPENAVEILEEARKYLTNYDGTLYLYKSFEYYLNINIALRISNLFNFYINENAPWKLLKQGKLEEAQNICTAVIHGVKIIATMLKPVLPNWVEKIERILLLKKPLNFENGIEIFNEGKIIGKYEILAERLKLEDVEKILKI